MHPQLMPHLARSPLTRTNALCPIFINQLYRPTIHKSHLAAQILSIHYDQELDKRHRQTKLDFPFTYPMHTIITYQLTKVQKPHHRDTNQMPTLHFEKHNKPLAEFIKEYPYLTYCPHTLPFHVSNPYAESQINNLPEEFDPRTEKNKAIMRSRLRKLGS